MLYLAYAGILWGLVLIVILYGSITDNMIETFNNCSFAIIAALIATRGWLMAEEQVMKKISNYYTFIICILITFNYDTIIYVSCKIRKYKQVDTR